MSDRAPTCSLHRLPANAGAPAAIRLLPCAGSQSALVQMKLAAKSGGDFKPRLHH